MDRKDVILSAINRSIEAQNIQKCNLDDLKPLYSVFNSYRAKLHRQIRRLERRCVSCGRKGLKTVAGRLLSSCKRCLRKKALIRLRKSASDHKTRCARFRARKRLEYMEDHAARLETRRRGKKTQI